MIFSRVMRRMTQVKADSKNDIGFDGLGVQEMVVPSGDEILLTE